MFHENKQGQFPVPARYLLILGNIPAVNNLHGVIDGNLARL